MLSKLRAYVRVRERELKAIGSFSSTVPGGLGSGQQGGSLLWPGIPPLVVLLSSFLRGLSGVIARDRTWWRKWQWWFLYCCWLRLGPSQPLDTFAALVCWFYASSFPLFSLRGEIWWPVAQRSTGIFCLTCFCRLNLLSTKAFSWTCCKKTWWVWKSCWRGTAWSWGPRQICKRIVAPSTSQGWTCVVAYNCERTGVVLD